MINERFDKISNGHEPTNDDVEPPVTANGVVESIEKSSTPATLPVKAARPSPPPKRSAPSEESELSEPIDEPKPKKHKKQAPAEDDDAAFAARLQDEENRRGRPTRGGATRKRAPAKKDKSGPKKKKSAAKVKATDDSEVESADEAPKERKGGFHVGDRVVHCSTASDVLLQKLMILSQPLSEITGTTELSRPQTVKKVWEYIKAKDLQDPSDKRQIICDDTMRRVFKSEKVHMFTMNKILNQNLYPKDE